MKMEKLFHNSKQILTNYNFDEKVNYENLIIDLIENNSLSKFCRDIVITNLSDSFAYYEYYSKKLYFDFNKLIELYYKRFKNRNNINKSILRIIYHELVHLRQFQMIDFNEIKGDIFKKQLSTFVDFDEKYLPMEINADIISSLKLLDILDDDVFNANQIIWTYNLINDKYKYGSPSDKIDFKNNIYTTDYDKMVFGIIMNQKYLYTYISKYINSSKYNQQIEEKIYLNN